MLSPTELLTPPTFDLDELKDSVTTVMGPIEDEDDYYSDLEGDDENEFDDDEDDDFEVSDDDDDDDSDADDSDDDDDDDDLG